ncbi:MAG: Crp/Fnr family transcriptional regulator [Actinomycetota bacterium]|nr:Crp/Fnr family transcriptional regulator [Actinomycetota bacterium]
MSRVIVVAREAGVRDNEIMKVLATTTMFAGLERPLLEEVVSAGVLQHYRKGQILFGEGDPAERLYVVLEGAVKLYVVSEDGAELNLGHLGPGLMFGEVALADGGPRSAFAEITEPSTLFALGRTELFALLDAQPALVRNYLHQLGARIRATTDRSEDLVFKDLQGRVAKQLLSLASKDDAIEPMVSQQELANMVGGSRPTVNQILKHFEGRGYITVDNRRIDIRDATALHRLAGT